MMKWLSLRNEINIDECSVFMEFGLILSKLQDSVHEMSSSRHNIYSNETSVDDGSVIIQVSLQSLSSLHLSFVGCTACLSQNCYLFHDFLTSSRII